jgi:hypothetical protein
VSAAGILLDRGRGRAPQPHSGEDGGDITITITIRQILESDKEEPLLPEHETLEK